MNRLAVPYWCLILLCGLLVTACQSDPHDLPRQVDFSQHIKPILNSKCMSCHGGVRQQGGLSFLFRESMLRELETGHIAVVPGKSSKSTMVDRITSADPEVMMPPEGERLTDRETAMITKWIEQGAEWTDHWSFVPPDPEMRPPDIVDPWIKNDIDRFTLDHLRDRGLTPSAAATPATLVRRLGLDVTGLPVAADIADQYMAGDIVIDELIDDLLTSEHYGERWAAMWMDLARYADSQGYQKDKLRHTMWAYRDYVIHAFNGDKPFSQFTIEQLAGDLIPGAGDEQLLATAFHRNTLTNDEGGTDDEEYRISAVLDRVNTTYEVWQGLTMSCVQCHSHPYDPIVHEDYYTSYAIWNTTMDNDHPSDSPLYNLLSPAQSKLRRALLEERQQLENENVAAAKIDSIASLLASIQPIDVPVLQEQTSEERRTSHLFERGNWLVHGQEVSPAVPTFLNTPDTTIATRDRLQFAQWLVSEDNPLTARVIVNRVWAEIFGIGIVETTEDFGTQGALPSHPELLDYLALQFSTEWGWSMKRLVKEIVSSATYQQASSVTPELLERDPYNRLLARGPRFRLSAEQIRDQALVVSGLFNPEVYGPSVMPYQPEGVWNTIRHVASWEMSEDRDNYRRGLYTFWRRTGPYPSMMTFDTPSREICVSRRIRTNTPLQALVTLNDPVYTEATEQLAMKMLTGSTVQDKIAIGYSSLLYKSPDENTSDILTNLYNSVSEKYKLELQNKRAAKLSTKEIEAQATYAIAAALFNLDEVLMKG